MNNAALFNADHNTASVSTDRLLRDRPLTDDTQPARIARLTAADERSGFVEGAMQFALVLCLAASFIACGRHISAKPDGSTQAAATATMAGAAAKPQPSAPRCL